MKVQPLTRVLPVCRWLAAFRCDPPKRVTLKEPHHTLSNIHQNVFLPSQLVWADGAGYQPGPKKNLAGL